MKAIFNRFKSGLQRTKTLLVRNIHSIFTDVDSWSEDNYDQLEEALIRTDLGVHVTERIITYIKGQYETGVIKTSADIIDCTQALLQVFLANDCVKPIQYANNGPTVILLVGVNGSGKTTTSGKLANMWKEDGKSVILAACDTFRAAAIEQLKIWGKRVDCDVIAGIYGADPASIAYDAVHAAISRKVDILLIDTAGRQHTRKGLMDELEKINRIIGKACPGAPHETWLVVDGSTGTNALQQARMFKNSSNISGICITKLDGTSKGGIVVSIHDELQLPIQFVGLGEGMNDIQRFDPTWFTEALFSE